MFSDLDPMLNFKLEQELNAFQLRILPSLNIPRWQLRRVTKTDSPDRFDIAIDMWSYVLSGMAFYQNEQFKIYLAPESLWMLFMMELDRRFKEHDQDYPHSIGI